MDDRFYRKIGVQGSELLMVEGNPTFKSVVEETLQESFGVRVRSIRRAGEH